MDGNPVRALVGETPMMVTNSETGIQIRVTNRDFLFLPDELTIDDEQIWPRAGDRITETDGTEYEVPRRLEAHPSWVWDSQIRQVMRVHAQLVVGT